MAAHEIGQVAVLGHDCRACLAGASKEVGVLRVQETLITDMARLDGRSGYRAISRDGARAGRRARASRRQNGVVELLARVAETGSHVLELEIGKLFEDLLGTPAGRQKVENVAHPDAHSAHAGAPAALGGIHRDPIGDLRDALHGGLA